jgi:hypothetical protein
VATRSASAEISVAFRTRQSFRSAAEVGAPCSRELRLDLVGEGGRRGDRGRRTGGGALDCGERDRVASNRELEGDRSDRRRSAMLDRERELIAVPAQVEVRVAQAWNSLEPRRAWPARILAPPLRA